MNSLSSNFQQLLYQKSDWNCISFTFPKKLRAKTAVYEENWPVEWCKVKGCLSAARVSPFLIFLLMLCWCFFSLSLYFGWWRSIKARSFRWLDIISRSFPALVGRVEILRFVLLRKSLKLTRINCPFCFNRKLIKAVTTVHPQTLRN